VFRFPPLPCRNGGLHSHINGTGSSIIDTVFVCRSTGVVPRRWVVYTTEDVPKLAKEDLAKLQAGHIKMSSGDIRCIAYGHLVRLAIWHLRKKWDKKTDITKRISTVSGWLRDFGEWNEVEKHLKDSINPGQEPFKFVVRENVEKYGAGYDEISLSW
jgi:putative DNA methylase